MGIANRYRERLPNIRIVDASDRRGQAHARNVGARAAIGEALAFCDADDEVALGWVYAIGEALFRYDFVACRIDTEKLNPPWVYRALGVHPQREELIKSEYPPYLAHAGGGTLGVKRSVHDAVGGFDESLAALEDTDYCLRVQLAGVKLHFVPNALIHIRLRHKLTGMFHQARHWAAYSVKVYKKYRAPNTKMSCSWKRYIYHWVQLLCGVRYIRQKEGCAKWLWTLGWQIGLLQGSIMFWAPPPVPLCTYITWIERLRRAMREIVALVPPRDDLILVDEDKWGLGEVISGRRRIPFLEWNGQYWGPPPDDDTAIRELERLRQSGAIFIVFGWSTFWWLDYYAGFHHYLSLKFRCVLQNERLVVFDLRS